MEAVRWTMAQISRVQALESLTIQGHLETLGIRHNPFMRPGQSAFLHLQDFYTEEACAYESNSKIFADT